MSVRMNNLLRGWTTPRSAILYLLFSILAFPNHAHAHDPLEISATVYLHTNRLELRAVMMRPAILRVADHQAVPLLDFSIPSERDEAMPMLRSLAGGLFSLTCGTNSLRATETNVILGAEDHVGFNLVFPTTNATVKLVARLLAHLPSEDPYGVNIIVLDMVSNKVVEQKLLNAPNPVMELIPPTITATNQPPPVKPDSTNATPGTRSTAVLSRSSRVHDRAVRTFKLHPRLEAAAAGDSRAPLRRQNLSTHSPTPTTPPSNE